MSPKIDKHAAGIGVNGAEQCAQRVVKANDEDARAECLQIFRYETHPQLFAGADDKNGDEQDDEVTFQSKEISD